MFLVHTMKSTSIPPLDHASAPLLEMHGIDKMFPGVHALQEIDLTLNRGEVLALVGENGAGKSTLMKILGGAVRPDRGVICLHGHPCVMRSPTIARQAGISTVYQEFNLIPSLTVRENILLGLERTRGGLIRAAEERQCVAELFARIGIAIDPETRCGDLTVAQQQIVEIAKALAIDAKILVMDEPTAALAVPEVRRLLAIVRELRQRGLGIIYVSHRLEEVFAIADRVMILRDGQEVATRPVAEVGRHELIEMMVGRTLESEFPKRHVRIGDERLRVEHLWRGDVVRDVSFHVRGGEILGIAGLAGSGRTETVRLVFGADRYERGSIHVNGQPVVIRSPRDAIHHGICLLTEDRKSQGVILNHGVRDNFALPNLDHYLRWRVLDKRRERTEFASYVDELKIKISGQDQLAGNLSGGNQQKLVLAKWLARNADVIIFDEPTRGIDVGSKYDIHVWMNRLAAAGKGLIMISSELPEVIGMSDRIVVMHEGQVKGEVTDVDETTQEDILAMAMAIA